MYTSICVGALGRGKKGKKRKAGKEKHLLSPWWLQIFPVRDVWRQNNHCAYGLRAREIIVWSIQISGERGNRPKADGLSCWVIRQRAEEITQWIDTIETTQTHRFIIARSWARYFLLLKKGNEKKNLHISRQAQIQYILEWFSCSSLSFLISIEPFSLFLFYLCMQIFFMVFLVLLVFYSSL